MFICYVATCSDGHGQSACLDITNLESPATFEIATTSKCGRRASKQAMKQKAGEYYYSVDKYYAKALKTLSGKFKKTRSTFRGTRESALIWRWIRLTFASSRFMIEAF